MSEQVGELQIIAHNVQLAFGIKSDQNDPSLSHEILEVIPFNYENGVLMCFKQGEGLCVVCEFVI